MHFPTFHPSEAELGDNYLKHILRFLAKSLFVLVGSLPHSTLKVGEERPHCVVAMLDVALQRTRNT